MVEYTEHSERAPRAPWVPALWVALGLIFLAAVGLGLHRAWPLLFPELVEEAAHDPGCELRVGPCAVTLPSGGTVSLSVEPREIPVMTPLDFAVEVEGLHALGAEIDFAGVDMNMGYNRVALRQAQPGRYVGQGTLPVCVRNRMTWEAKVLVQTPEGLVAAPFRFDTFRP